MSNATATVQNSTDLVSQIKAMAATTVESKTAAPAQGPEPVTSGNLLSESEADAMSVEELRVYVRSIMQHRKAWVGSATKTALKAFVTTGTVADMNATIVAANVAKIEAETLAKVAGMGASATAALNGVNGTKPAAAIAGSFEGFVQFMANAAVSAAVETGLTALRSEADKLVGALPKTPVLSITFGGDSTPKIMNTADRHESLTVMLRLASSLGHRTHLHNLCLFGPAGTGKSTLAKHFAEALDLPFHLIPCTPRTSDAHLFGPIVPNLQTGEEEWHKGPLADLYEKGGVVLLDEVFLTDPGALAALNAGLAGDELSIPRTDKVLRRNPNFWMIFADNTTGKGGDTQYVARQIADMATRDRFTFLKIGYDTRVDEMVVSASIADKSRREATLAFVTHVRAKADAQRINEPCGTRMLDRLACFIGGGFTFDEATGVIFSTWSERDRNAVMSGYEVPACLKTPPAKAK